MHLKRPPGVIKKAPTISFTPEQKAEQKKQSDAKERSARMLAKKRLRALIDAAPVKVYVPEPWKEKSAVPSKETWKPDPNLFSPPVEEVIPDEIRLGYATQLAPLYNKGPYQLITDPDLVRDIGRKTNQLKQDGEE